jgi:hypothetical protein
MNHPVRNAGVIAQRSGDSMVLFHMESGKYFSLNECGSRIWDACDGTMSENEIAARLTAEYNTPASVYNDVSALLHRLTVNGLLTTSSQEP